MSDVSIKVKSYPNRTELMKVVKAATGENFSQIHTRLAQNLPVAEIRLKYGLRNSPKLLKLLADLRDQKCEFEIFMNGRPASEKNVRAEIWTARQIAIEQTILADLEVTGRTDLTDAEKKEIAAEIDADFNF